MQNATGQKTTQEETPKLQISVIQVTAAVLASITSAVILSRFGVAGTYAGTAIGSAVSTISVALYSHTMRQARRRVRTYANHRHEYLIRAAPHDRRVEAGPPVTIPQAAWNRRHPRTVTTVAPVVARRSHPSRRGWRARLDRLERWFAGLPLWGKAGVTAAAAFVLAVAAIILFQSLSGHPLPNLVWGVGSSSNHPDAGCAFGQCGGASHATVQNPVSTPATGTTAQPTFQPTPAPTTAPSPVATPATGPSAVPSAAPPLPSAGP